MQIAARVRVRRATRFGAGDGRETNAASTDRERSARSDRARLGLRFRPLPQCPEPQPVVGAGGRLLLGLLIAAFVPSSPVVVSSTA